MMDFLDPPKMERITKEAVFNKRAKKPTSRSLVRDKTGISQDKKFFSIPFYETMLPIFEKQTGLQLTKGRQYNDCDLMIQYNNYDFVIKDDSELRIIQGWVKNQGTRIFLKDCLSLSIALDKNFIDNTSGRRTRMGELEYRGKHQQDKEAINQLADEVTLAINDLPFYIDADLICSVPSQPDKIFHLPSEVTHLVRAKIGKQDVTDGFSFGKEKESATNLPFEQKWKNWENTQISFQNNNDCNVEGKTVILIDDKYQSGITIQYIAMKLQEAGVHQVYGLCFVKTLGNKDNKQ